MTRYEFPDEPPSVGWDIHCHTVYSDGTVTPTDMVRQAVELGLHGVGIADHDTTTGWDEATDAARAAGLPLLRGTEITAVADGLSVHMLAYQYDSENPHIVALFTRLREARLKRTQRMVELLSKDYPISWDDVLAQVHQGERTTIGRPHIADALVAAGVYSNRSAAFAGVIGASSPYYLPTPSPAALEVVEAVRGAGGVSVVAHAADLSRNPRIISDECIEELAAAGLDGLEVWHRGNPADQRRRLLRLAKRLDLLVTGGSDWHGAGKPNAMGENLTDDATVAEIVHRGALPLA